MPFVAQPVKQTFSASQTMEKRLKLHKIKKGKSHEILKIVFPSTVAETKIRPSTQKKRMTIIYNLLARKSGWEINALGFITIILILHSIVSLFGIIRASE